MALLRTLAYESLPLGVAATGLTLAKLLMPGVTEVEVTVEGGDIRWLRDGSVPAAGGPGKLAGIGDRLTLTLPEAALAKFIPDPAGARTVHADYRGPR